MNRALLTLVGVASILLVPSAPVAAQDLTDDVIDKAVERGAEYLISMQSDDGSWRTHKLGKAANTVMCMLGLAYAEYDPRSEAITKGLKALMSADLTTESYESYLTAFRLQALAKWYKNKGVDREMKDLIWKRINADVKRIIDGQTDDGGWGYKMIGGPRFADFSNVQICMLGLGEAIKVGVEIPRRPLEKAQLLYVTGQLKDGGWHYGRQVKNAWPWTTDQAMPTYGSMTAAGVASLYITRDYLYRGMGCPCRGGRSNYRRNKVDLAIEKGLKWLGERYTPKKNPKSTHFRDYWLYSCERVGLASGIKYFGAHNWYAEGARVFLAGQEARGSWGHRIYDGHWSGGSTGTAWAILFLVKGRAPILMNKLRFDGPWNQHPHDLKNLARYVGDHKEQTFAWQVITLDAPVDEWHDSPILYMTPEAIIKFSDEEKKKLRKFTDDGGTIFFEASCGNRTVRSWWKKMAQEIWPEFEFRTIDRDHPIWKADLPIRRPIRGLMEMADGVRSFIFFAPSDVSCAWNTKAVTRRIGEFRLGVNMYAYATDRAKIRSRLARATTARTARGELKTLSAGGAAARTIARMKHGGDWNVSERYRLVEKLCDRLGGDEGTLATTAAGPVAPSDAALPAAGILYATGRAGISLLPDEREALKKRLASGGFIFVDATKGDLRFRGAFTTLATEMGWTVKRLDKTHPILTGAIPGGKGHDLTHGVRFSFHTIANAQVPPRLDLQGIYVAGKLVGVYSPLDVMYSQAGLRAFGTLGYDVPTARRIIENIVLYAMTSAAPVASE